MQVERVINQSYNHRPSCCRLVFFEIACDNEGDLNVDSNCEGYGSCMLGLRRRRIGLEKSQFMLLSKRQSYSQY